MQTGFAEFNAYGVINFARMYDLPDILYLPDIWKYMIIAEYIQFPKRYIQCPYYGFINLFPVSNKNEVC